MPFLQVGIDGTVEVECSDIVTNVIEDVKDSLCKMDDSSEPDLVDTNLLSEVADDVAGNLKDTYCGEPQDEKTPETPTDIPPEAEMVRFEVTVTTGRGRVPGTGCIRAG